MDGLTGYVLDTVALVRHLEDSLPPSAETAVGEAEVGRALLWLPEIALGEFVYLALRGRLQVSDPRAALDEVLDQLRAAAYLRVACLDPPAWDLFLTLDVSELHDRMIAADALYRGLPLISNDQAFDEVPSLVRIWD